MDRKLPYDPCRRRYLPARLRAEILLRQNGACADCGTRLILGFFVFDHRPSLGLRTKLRMPTIPSGLPPSASAATSARRRRT